MTSSRKAFCMCPCLFQIISLASGLSDLPDFDLAYQQNYDP